MQRTGGVAQLRVTVGACYDQVLARPIRARAEREQAPVGQHDGGFEIELVALVAERVVETAPPALAARQQPRLEGRRSGAAADRDGVDVVLDHDQTSLPAPHGRRRAHEAGEVFRFGATAGQQERKKSAPGRRRANHSLRHERVRSAAFAWLQPPSCPVRTYIPRRR